jgi:hypothetical protein
MCGSETYCMVSSLCRRDKEALEPSLSLFVLSAVCFNTADVITFFIIMGYIGPSAAVSPLSVAPTTLDIAASN